MATSPSKYNVVKFRTSESLRDVWEPEQPHSDAVAGSSRQQLYTLRSGKTMIQPFTDDSVMNDNTTILSRTSYILISHA